VTLPKLEARASFETAQVHALNLPQAFAVKYVKRVKRQEKLVALSILLP
jgi:hypothetical protein